MLGVVEGSFHLWIVYLSMIASLLVCRVKLHEIASHKFSCTSPYPQQKSTHRFCVPDYVICTFLKSFHPCSLILIWSGKTLFHINMCTTVEHTCVCSEPPICNQTIIPLLHSCTHLLSYFHFYPKASHREEHGAVEFYGCHGMKGNQEFQYTEVCIDDLSAYVAHWCECVIVVAMWDCAFKHVVCERDGPCMSNQNGPVHPLPNYLFLKAGVVSAAKFYRSSEESTNPYVLKHICGCNRVPNIMFAVVIVSHVCLLLYSCPKCYVCGCNRVPSWCMTGSNLTVCWHCLQHSKLKNSVYFISVITFYVQVTQTPQSIELWMLVLLCNIVVYSCFEAILEIIKTKNSYSWCIWNAPHSIRNWSTCPARRASQLTRTRSRYVGERLRCVYIHGWHAVLQDEKNADSETPGFERHVTHIF